MEKRVNKPLILQGVKSGLFSLVFACVGVLLLALVAKIFGISDSVLPIINQALKAVAAFLGTAIAVKEEKFLFKATLGAVVFWITSFLLFALLGGGFHWQQIALDLVISLVPSLIVAVVKSRRA